MIGRLILILMMVGSAASAMAQEQLVADLNQKNVRITTDFNGAELLLFGALDRASVDDIAILVTGPQKRISIRRKEQVMGIWLNTENADVVMPSFYHILSTKPLHEIASLSTMKINRIGFEFIRFKLAPDSRIDEGAPAEWKNALIRNMEETGLWSNQPRSVRIISEVLFRANIQLPAHIVPGEYEVRTIHFRDGAVLSDSVSTLNVAKSGLSAQVYHFAHHYAPFYGIFAILFAVASGWIAAIAFRK